jgi:hypothetical protein
MFSGAIPKAVEVCDGYQKYADKFGFYFERW